MKNFTDMQLALMHERETARGGEISKYSVVVRYQGQVRPLTLPYDDPEEAISAFLDTAGETRKELR